MNEFVSGNPQKEPTTRDPGPVRDPLSRLWILWAVLAVGVVGLLLWSAIHPAVQTEPEVVAYCAQDQEYAEPLFHEFEQETGIQVHPVFDSEAVKTVGMANRLLAERAHPQCDVFWGNEEMRTRELAKQKVFRETNGWSAFGYRSRRMVINTTLVKAEEAPKSLLDLTNAGWRGKIALAYPQFGTTATHFHALRQLWGEAAWLNWCRALAENKPFLVDGNSVVVKTVGSGQAAVGLTDSDDIAAGQREGLPVAALPMNPETLLIPNTVGLVASAPHPKNGEALSQFLCGSEVVKRLVEAGALEGLSISEVSQPTLQVNWEALLRDVEPVTKTLNQLFLR